MGHIIKPGTPASKAAVGLWGLSFPSPQAIESHLNLTLAEDLGEALADGVILCQLANRLCPRSVPFIHVPSPAVVSLSLEAAGGQNGSHSGRRVALAGNRLPGLHCS